MTHIPQIDPNDAETKSLELLAAVKKQIGMVPNLYEVIAHSPVVLEAHLNHNAALAQGVLTKQLREQIAVAIAGTNGCDYCASAHTALGKMAGVTGSELADNMQGQSKDSKTLAAITFARTVVENRGHIKDVDLQAVRDAGFDNEEIVEIIAHVGLNIFTNYINHIAGTEIDFPVVSTVKG